jgi:putative nucleotidyltransferase with HDIG domain
MSMPGSKTKKSGTGLKNHFKSQTLQKFLIILLTIILAFVIIESGAAPKKYRLNLGDKSPYDITAPRDIENKLKTEENALAAANAVPSVMIRLENIPIDVLNTVDDFITNVYNVRKDLIKSIESQGTSKNDKNYRQKLELGQAIAANKLSDEIAEFNILLSDEQVQYLVSKAGDEEIDGFKKISRELFSNIMKEDINKDNLASKIVIVQNDFQETELSQELKNIGALLTRAVLKPNSTIDVELTEERRREAEKNARDNNKVIITEGSRILSVDDIVTKDKLMILEELNFLETGKFDYVFVAGIFVLLLLLSFVLLLYIRIFCKKVINSRNDLILLSVIIIMTLAVSRVIYVYSPLLIPIFVASMLISILLDPKLALVVNLVLTIAISLITKGNLPFIYLAIIGGSFSAFVVEKANQRSKLSAAGIIIAIINILIVVSLGVINKSGLRTIAKDCIFVSINGIVSIILTVGILPFFESTFNIITPLKLLELANPNQPLIKRLLMEAPGTYHHSLMVGNLAEVATEAIEGNALLARVGAYYHDVGKLKRPNFFIENQLTDNPHDRMTPNLSTLVITSHTEDGLELSIKYKIPKPIRDIILQHHGTTMVVYFYHKAKKADKCEIVKHDDFRYSGPKPSSKEAAVVMLADSVEAAVRSMTVKTEGKIEGMVRKIIKDKLDDGQLDLCDLTLNDLDKIARGFMRVFSGLFHEREEYPELREKKMGSQPVKTLDPLKVNIESETAGKKEIGVASEHHNR